MLGNSSCEEVKQAGLAEDDNTVTAKASTDFMRDLVLGMMLQVGPN